MSQIPAWMLAAYLATGLVLGAAYFTSLRWTIYRLASGRGMQATIAMIAGRFVLLGGVLTLASLQGALPLLLTALGVFIARAAILRRGTMA